MMETRLRGRTILITGGSAGIGRSTALEFARSCPNDLKIIITGRRKAPLEKVVEDIKNEVGDGVKVRPCILDISDFEAVAGFVDSLPEEWKGIDILVNNAGLARGMEKAPDIAVDDINLTFDTNIVGLIHMTQAVLPRMLKRGESGQGDIISLGSIAGQDPYPGGSIYCATKTAIRSFSDALRKELIATRIRVIQIDPGQVETVGEINLKPLEEANCPRNFQLHAFEGTRPKLMQYMRESHVFHSNHISTYLRMNSGGEPLTPDDIAEIIVFAATRRENVVFADSLVFPSHQVSLFSSSFPHRDSLQQYCVAGHLCCD